MSVNLKASEVPPAFAERDLLLNRARNSNSGAAPVAENVIPGDTNWGHKLRILAARLDLAGRYGGGGAGVVFGLTVAAGEGLTVVIAPGHALIDGVIEVSAEQTVPVVDEIARIWLWLMQNGTILAINVDVKPPGRACMLGSVTTTMGKVTDVDTSGVFYLKGGALFRETADAGVPNDAPPSELAFYAVTRGGLYLWDGSRYWQLAKD